MKKFIIQSGELLHMDLLRFIASIGIVLCHSYGFLFPAASRTDLIVTKTGGLAMFVDLFFVISGFVIAYVYSDTVVTFPHYFRFLKRRFARLFPLHWLTLIISVLIFLVIKSLGFAMNTNPDNSILCLADTFFLLHGLWPCGNEIYFNGQSWSISAEISMYVIYPALFFLSSRLKITLPIIAFSVISWIVYNSYRESGSFYFDLNDIPIFLRVLPSFLIGISLFTYRDSLPIMKSSSNIFFGFVIALSVSLFFDFPTPISLALIYLTAAITVSADRNQPSSFLLMIAPLGQMTYSIYMWHGIIILIFVNGLCDKILKLTGIYMAFALLMCYLFIFVVSYFSYFYFESPIRRWIDKYSFYNQNNQINS